MSRYNFYTKKILLLDATIPSKYEGIVSSKIYANKSGFLRLFRKIHYHTSIPGKSFWYNDWKNDVKKYDIIIIFDGILGSEIIDYIRKNNKKCRIILYYINKISNRAKNNPQNFLGKDCEIWSFDKNDCRVYNLKYNHYFYEEYSEKIIDLPLKYDVFFVGVDKGRLNDLVRLKNFLQEKCFSCKFIILKDKRKKYSINDEKHLQNSYIKYNEVLEYIAQSRVILDFVREGQNGITLRPMESIFHSKKLITNNKDILNYDFYDSSNIFILGYDQLDKIESFIIENEFKDISQEVLDEYLFEAWLERFL